MKKVISNIFYNSIYQVLILFIPLITIPYISRHLGVANVGLNDYVVAVATFLAYIIPMGIPNIGNREIAKADPEELPKKFSQLWLIQLCAGSIVIVVFTLITTFILDNKLLFYLEIPFLIGYTLDISWFFLGIGEVKKVILRNAGIKVLSLILIFTLVHTKNDLPLYIGINSGSLFLSNLVFWFALRSKLNGQIHFTTENYPTSYIKEALLLMIPTMMAQLYSNFDNIMVDNIAGDVQNGYYSQSQKVARMFVAISQSMNVIIMPLMARAGKNKSEDEVNNIFKTSLDYIFMVGLMLSCVLMTDAHRFVPFYWGKSWNPMIPNMFWVSLIIIFIGYGGVFINQYAISKQISIAYTVPYVVGAVTNVTLNAITLSFGQSMAGTINLVITEFMVAATAVFLLRKYIDLKFLMHGQWKFILAFLITLIFGLLLPINLKSNFITLAIQSIVTVIVYIGLLLIFKTRLLTDLKMFLNSRKKAN